MSSLDLVSSAVTTDDGRRVEKAFDCSFYVVHNNKIVGRYGAHFSDALSHLRLLHVNIMTSCRSSSRSTTEDHGSCNTTTRSTTPVSTSNSSSKICSLPRLCSISSLSDMRYEKETCFSRTRSSDNRAIIPVINNRICHPFHLLSFRPMQEYILHQEKDHGLTKQLLFQSMQCCHWDNPLDLQRMQYIVQREHCILQPAIYSKSQIRFNANVIISLPTSGRNGEKDFSSRVRSKCLDFLNELQHPNGRGSNVRVVRDDE